MLSKIRLQSLLERASLTPAETNLYLFVQENPGCSIADACRDLSFGKSTLYRAFERLRALELIRSNEKGWETSLQSNSLRGLIRNLENEQRKRTRLIATLKAIDSCKALDPRSRISGLETLNVEETFERYIDLSEMKWGSMFGFGSWEDFNERGNIMALERQFINNRMKRGGKAFVAVTKEGPGTREFIDYNHDLDHREDRISKKVEFFGNRPVWINVFEGNNFVHLWNITKQGEIGSTFIESAPLAEFYRQFISSVIA